MPGAKLAVLRQLEKTQSIQEDIHDIPRQHSASSIAAGYRGALQLQEFSFILSQGECLVLSGSNGAGKSTAIRVLAGAMPKQCGEVHFYPLRSHGSKARIAWVPQELALYTELSVEKNVRFFAKLLHPHCSQSDINESLEKVELLSLKNKKLDELSGGMQRRVSLACALAQNADIILLDEPTVGLDAKSKSIFWETLHAEKLAGASLIVASHDREEIGSLVDHRIHLSMGKMALSEVISKDYKR